MDTEDGLQIYADSLSHRAICPCCGQESTKVHGCYQRHPQEISSVGRHVHIVLTVKRFRCETTCCKQKTFTEQHPNWLQAYARRTNALTTLMAHMSVKISAEVAHQLLHCFQIKVSGDTLLRILRRFDQSNQLNDSPRVIGVDDWAFKRGRNYGTIIVNLETHRVIDLLPDRTGETLTIWLQNHPTIELITRDRSTEYAKGIQQGAPQVTQVADRWHLLVNLRQMLERYFTAIHTTLRQLPVSETFQGILDQQRSTFVRSRGERVASQTIREAKLLIYEQVQKMRQQGCNIAQITRDLGYHPATITKYFYATSFPERKRRKPTKSILDAYIPYLEQRLIDDCEQNAQQLWREIQQQGYPGTSKQVMRWLHLKRTSHSPKTPPHHQDIIIQRAPQVRLPSSKELAWLIVRDPDTLSVEEQTLLSHIQQHQNLVAMYKCAQDFVQMFRHRLVEKLDDWLTQSNNLGVYQLQTFVKGLKQDYDAVRAALTFAWSNGQTEGQVNRLKFIKRQMYGRAKFDLLRIRVLTYI